MLHHVFTNAKKSCPRIVLLQFCQHPFRNLRMRTVIKSQVHRMILTGHVPYILRKDFFDDPWCFNEEPVHGAKIDVGWQTSVVRPQTGPQSTVHGRQTRPSTYQPINLSTYQLLSWPTANVPTTSNF